MAPSHIGVTEFVRGMAWHDIGKPFALGTPRHTVLGHWLLQLAGYRGEALVALAHGGRGRDELLVRYLQLGGTSLPGVLLLCSSLDRLAASVYSLQSRGQKSSRHSWQNPFSRLPIAIPGWHGAPIIPHHDLEQTFEPALWASMRSELPAEWQSALTNETKKLVESGRADGSLLHPAPLPAGNDAIEVLVRYMNHYPERTYPSVNDTSLAQHCRLSGILGFVTYRNIQAGEHKDWLDASITLSNGGRLDKPIPDAPRAVREHLTGSLVRVAFEGHRSLFRNALRVDDIHGARELTHQTRSAFDRAMTAELGVPDLARFLAISESQFDLAYLLPLQEEPVEGIVHRAYETALSQVATAVFERLAPDFPQIAEQRAELKRQLGEMACVIRISAVEPPKETGFNGFAAQYGHNLLQAYLDCSKGVASPMTVLPDGINRRDHITVPDASKFCEVCGDNPVLTPPENLDNDGRVRWQKRCDHAAHNFRGEREALCLSCVARRTMAQGKVAKKLDPIVHPMLKQEGDQLGVWHSEATADGPPLPPSMAPTVQLMLDDDMVDMGAFYVRYRRTREGVDRSALDVFPTTSYAADVTGNVVLISLEPTDELFACYAYDEALQQFDPCPQPSRFSATESVALWQVGFAQGHLEAGQRTQNLREQGRSVPDWSEPVRHVRPHLARVMERIRRIQLFYDDLYCRLADTPPRIRVLPLDTEYPTLRLLVPANELDKVLRRLEESVTETLFSAQPEEDRAGLHKLLSLVVPDLLHGTVILFKQKYPLYLALEAERDLFRQLQDSDPEDRLADRPGNASWYGIRLGFSDLRGTLSQVAPQLAEVTYADLLPILDLADVVDRRTVTGRGAITNRAPTADQCTRQILTQLANAVTVVRAKRIGLDQEKALALNEERNFAPVLFIKRATRR